MGIKSPEAKYFFQLAYLNTFRYKHSNSNITMFLCMQPKYLPNFHGLWATWNYRFTDWQYLISTFEINLKEPVEGDVFGKASVYGCLPWSCTKWKLPQHCINLLLRTKITSTQPRKCCDWSESEYSKSETNSENLDFSFQHFVSFSYTK